MLNDSDLSRSGNRKGCFPPLIAVNPLACLNLNTCSSVSCASWNDRRLPPFSEIIFKRGNTVTTRPEER